MSDLRTEIAALIVGCTDANTNDANFAAGRILAIPDLAEAVEMRNLSIARRTDIEKFQSWFAARDRISTKGE